MAKETVQFSNTHNAQWLYGHNDRNLRMLERELDVKLIARDKVLTVSGRKKNIANLKKLLVKLSTIYNQETPIESNDLGYIIDEVKNEKHRGASSDDDVPYRIDVPSHKKSIYPKSAGQKRYVKTMHQEHIIFSIGPAGTGKTYLAMAMAVAALMRDEVSRIILTRPAVEAGETLGFLPGNLFEKVNPYLRPLYDALYDMMEIEKIKTLMDRDVIEIAPLAFMRGRTLNWSFVILDEAQNTTVEQMKMFLTRLGQGSKAVITGDITQVDLPANRASGLIQVQDILTGIGGIEFVYLDERDVARHELVPEIIKAYEKKEKQKS